jgi:hypothetical protein
MSMACGAHRHSGIDSFVRFLRMARLQASNHWTCCRFGEGTVHPVNWACISTITWKSIRVFMGWADLEMVWASKHFFQYETRAIVIASWNHRLLKHAHRQAGFASDGWDFRHND